MYILRAIIRLDGLGRSARNVLRHANTLAKEGYGLISFCDNPRAQINHYSYSYALLAVKRSLLGSTLALQRTVSFLEFIRRVSSFYSLASILLIFVGAV